MEQVMGAVKLTELNETAKCGDLFQDGESAAIFASGEAQLPAREEPAAHPLRGKAIVTPRGEMMPFELLCA
jgi:hypothetical protein